MKNIMKKIIVVMLIGLMMLGMTACGGSQKADTPSNENNSSGEETFKIGLSLSYTGPTAQYGIEARNGVLLALEKINAEGGFNGAKGVLATAYDNKGSVEEAVKNAQKLIQNEDVDAIIGSQVSAKTLATGQYFNEAKIFTIGMGTSATWMKQGWEYVIRGAVNYDFIAAELVKMVKEMGITKIAIMKDQQEAALAFADQFEELGKEVGIEVVATESCEVEDTDLSSQCARLLAAKPQAILMSMTSSDCGYFVKQIRQHGYTGLLFDKESFYSDLIDIAGVENSNYILFCNPYVTYTDIEDCDIEYMREFLQLYKNEYGELPRTEIPYRAWDSMMVLWEATKLAGSNKSEDLIKVVPQIKIQGLGGIMDYSNGDGEPYHNVSRFVLLDGKNISWENWMENGGYELYKDETGNEY